MTVSTFFLVHTIERMNTVVPVSYRRIFHGYGVYHRGVQFAVLLNDQVYFRADDDSRHLYDEQGLPQFAARSSGSLRSDFYQIPPSFINNTDLLQYWMRVAIDAAARCGDPEDESLDTPSLPRRRMIYFR